jgi:hypothetical protein
MITGATIEFSTRTTAVANVSPRLYRSRWHVAMKLKGAGLQEESI